MSRSTRTRKAVVALVALVLASSPVSGQSPAPPMPDAATLAAADALYPGVEEILRVRDPRALRRLSGVLTTRPNAESLTMLLWMLRYAPASATSLRDVARVVRDVPIAPLADVWRTGEQEARETAIAVLADVRQFRSPEDEELRERTLIAALSDSSRHVRQSAASALRAIGSAEANAALARAASGVDVDAFVHAAATGRPPAALHPLPDLSTLPPPLLALFSEADPAYRETLANADDQKGVRQLVEALALRRNDPRTTDALTWLFAYVHPALYPERLSSLLSNAPHVERVSLTALIPSLTSDLSSRRAATASLIERILPARRTALSAPERTALSSALIARLADAAPDVRLAAASALGRVPGDEAVRALLDALDEPSVSSPFVSSAIRALGAIGDRAAVPTLERWARSDASVRIRTEAFQAIVALTKPRNPGAEARRLLWEQPDMAWETDVISGGRAALPRAWQALASNDDRERRAAAALLGWLPDTGSIAPILAALDRAPGAIMRQQLAFDLQMILLDAGEPVDARDQLQLAGEHLRFLFETAVSSPFHDGLRRRLRRATAMAIHPDATVSPLSFTLEAESANGSDEAPGRFTVRTQRLATDQSFREALDEGAIGVIFHPILQSNGVALVTTTVMVDGYGGGSAWVSVYRREAGSWTRIRVPVAPFSEEPTNLMPAIDRNYGANHPMRRVRLAHRMREIERTGALSARLEDLDADLPIAVRYGPEASIRPLLEPYRQSSAFSVQYTAERHAVALGAAPNVPFWMRALERTPPDEVLNSAIGVIGGYVVHQVASAPVTLSDRDRQQLIAAMRAPVSVNPSLRPSVLPSPRDVDEIRRSDRFALIRVRRTGPLGGSGYMMLFERRGDTWVFLCTG